MPTWVWPGYWPAASSLGAPPCVQGAGKPGRMGLQRLGRGAGALGMGMGGGVSTRPCGLGQSTSGSEAEKGCSGGQRAQGEWPQALGQSQSWTGGRQGSPLSLTRRVGIVTIPG